MASPGDDEITTDSGREMQAADLFDLRRIIGGLFLLYGIVLTDPRGSSTPAPRSPRRPVCASTCGRAWA